MARFKLLPTLLKTPPAVLLIITFKGSKEKSNKYKKT